MDIFLDRILNLLPVMGTTLFQMPHVSNIETNDKLICKIKGLTAYGNRTDNGFVVYKNSEAVLEDSASSKRARIRREWLVNNGILVENDSKLIFERDYEFTSPSLAASAIKGGATNGLTAWKDKNGRKLKEIDEA